MVILVCENFAMLICESTLDLFTDQIQPQPQRLTFMVIADHPPIITVDPRTIITIEEATEVATVKIWWILKLCRIRNQSVPSLAPRSVAELPERVEASVTGIPPCWEHFQMTF